jgi:Family of unknown function (DUF5989)
MLDFIKDMSVFLLRRRKFWLMPVIIISTLLGALLLFSQGSVIAPFIYTIF